jgi:hypothetical protein
MISISSLGEFLCNHPESPIDLELNKAMPTLVVQHESYSELLWTLRLTEFFGDKSNNYGYQPDANWSSQGKNKLSYRNSAVSGDDKIKGNTSCIATAEKGQLKFEISVTNNSSEPWLDCWAWLCLIHRWARAFQANCELPVGEDERIWVPVNSLKAPMERWLKWCPVLDRLDAAERVGQNRGTRWQPHIQAKQGSVRAWRIEGKEKQIIQLTSPNAFILGWSHWPCTDMGVFFGTIQPGQTEHIRGSLEFMEASFVPI